MAELGRNAQRNRARAERKKELRESQIRARREERRSSCWRLASRSKRTSLRCSTPCMAPTSPSSKGTSCSARRQKRCHLRAIGRSHRIQRSRRRRRRSASSSFSLSPAKRERERLGTINAATGEPDLDTEPECLAAVVLHVALPWCYPVRSLPRLRIERHTDGGDHRSRASRSTR